ncbi:MAG: Ger(x)C family spore germination protein [Clostridia bacterium]|nr:Ger(x)C family spore germination protein [Clostridia bacterium]
MKRQIKLDKFKAFFLAILVFTESILFTGCWNYREIDMLDIVAGVAVDKGKDKRFCITTEVIRLKGGKDIQPFSQIVSAEGDTMFDAVRNLIAITGKRLYWSHAKVIIISEELAREGVIKVLDWYSRDTETRADVDILISKQPQAKDIFAVGAESFGEDIISFGLDRMLENGKSLSKAPKTEIWKILNNIEGEGISAITPTVSYAVVNGKKSPNVIGCAVFKGEKLIGFLDADETKALLFVQDQIKGGILIQTESSKDASIPLSLEIFKNKTKVKPLLEGGKPSMEVSIETTVAIDELEDGTNFMEENKKKILEKDAAKTLEEQITKLVQKVQKQFDSDIFGFGAKIEMDKPKEWEKLRNDWDKTFKSLSVTVSSSVHVRNSAMLAEPYKVGD